MTVLCLSPHLDDAVLSVGGHLAETRLAGEAVLVVNLFTSSTQPFSAGPMGFRARALAPERLQEEIRAMAVLGVEPLNLGLLDAPFRDRRYRAYHRLLGPVPAWEQSEHEALSTVMALAQERGATRILAPLAVGGHVDHRIAHRVGRALEGAYAVSYYEDMPYALVPYALSRRMRELGVSRPAGLPSVREVVRDVRRHYERHPVALAKPAWQRRLASLAIGAWTSRQERHLRRAAAPLAWELSPEVLPVSAEGFARKLQAIACYESQLPTLFASLQAAEDAYRSYAAGIMTAPTSYAERVWQSAARDCAVSSEPS